MSTSVDVLVIGAGAAGLAARAAIDPRRECVTLEAAEHVGGLLRVHEVGPFVFDTVLHVLSFRNDRMERALLEGIPEGVRRFDKRNLVWQGGTVVDYPYQFHAFQLPADARRAAIEGFARRPAVNGKLPHFDAWLLHQFGSGFHEGFFRPYNEKLYGVPLDSLDAGPMVWTIPADNEKAVLRGALGPQPLPATPCWYPRGRAGVSAVARALEERGLGPILCGRRAVSIDLSRRTVETEDGGSFRYRHLVSTAPLPVLARMARGLPPAVREAALALESRRVHVIEVGARGVTSALPADWTYFPDPAVPFYRLTRLERIAPDLCPAEHTALLLEHAGESPPDASLVESWLRALQVVTEEPLLHYRVRAIPHAYVLFRAGYRETIAAVTGSLAEHGVVSAGRYGAWRYANIEQTIEDGIRAAAAVRRAGDVPAEAATWLQ